MNAPPKMSAAKAVAGALGRDQNNFDLVRLTAAMLVIYDHWFSVVPESKKRLFVFIVWLCICRNGDENIFLF